MCFIGQRKNTDLESDINKTENINVYGPNIVYNTLCFRVTVIK